MVTKQEVMEYYRDARKDSNCGRLCPRVVEEYLERIPEDENGLYTLSGELLDAGREYYTLEMIKEGVKSEIKEIIKHLNMISEI